MEIPAPGFRPAQLAFGAGSVWFSGRGPESPVSQVYETTEGRPPVARTSGPGEKSITRANSTGSALAFAIRPPAAVPPAQTAPASFGIIATADGRVTIITGSAPAFSGDGATFAYVTREGNSMRLMTASTSTPAEGVAVRTGPELIDAPALTADGRRLAFQMMSNDDWEIYAIGRDGTGLPRVTREIQHDVLPVFLTPDRLVAAVGEPRHRRSHLYDLRP